MLPVLQLHIQTCIGGIIKGAFLVVEASRLQDVSVFFGEETPELADLRRVRGDCFEHRYSAVTLTDKSAESWFLPDVSSILSDHPWLLPKVLL